MSEANPKSSKVSGREEFGQAGSAGPDGAVNGPEEPSNWDAESDILDDDPFDVLSGYSGRGVRIPGEGPEQGEEDLQPAPGGSGGGGGGEGPPPGPGSSGDAYVEDSKLEEVLEGAGERFGADYRQLFDSITWEDLNWYEEKAGILGLTEFDPEQTLMPYEDIRGDGELEMTLDKRLAKHEYFPGLSAEDLYHTFGHEGVHGEWFRDVYGLENRERGMPVETAMVLHGMMKSDDNAAVEAATEYTARRQNPEIDDVNVQPYNREVAELERQLESMGAEMSKEQESRYEGSDRQKGVEIRYADADFDFYVEHGEIGDEEYVLALGDDERLQPYLEELEAWEDADPEVFRYDSPLDPETGEYEMPEAQEFVDFAQDASSEYFDDYEPESYDPEEESDWYADQVAERFMPQADPAREMEEAL